MLNEDYRQEEERKMERREQAMTRPQGREGARTRRKGLNLIFTILTSLTSHYSE